MTIRINLLAVLVLVLAISPAMALDFTWKGINTEANADLDNDNVDTATLWDDGAAGTGVPGAGDTATFNQDDSPSAPVAPDTPDSYNKEIVIKTGATFAPDRMTVQRLQSNGPWTPFYIQKSLTLDKLTLDNHNSQVASNFRIGTDPTGTGFAERRGWMTGTLAFPLSGSVNIEGNRGAKDYDLSAYADIATLVAAINADTATVTGVSASTPSGTVLWLYSEVAGSTQFVKVTRGATVFPVIHRATVLEEEGKKLYGLDTAETTLTLSGADPIAITGTDGWNNLYLAANSHLAFSSTNCTINTTMPGSISGAAGSSVDFTATGQSGADQISVTGLAVTLPTLLNIRSDQVWGASYIKRTMSAANQYVVTSSDGPTLNNLDDVAFLISGAYASESYNMPGGEFRGIESYYTNTSGKEHRWMVQGNLALKGAAQDRPGYGLVLHVTNAAQVVFDLNDYDLTTVNGIQMLRDGSTGENKYMEFQTRLIDATTANTGGGNNGSIINIGGDLVYSLNQYQAGYPLVMNGALNENRATGITGDANTVVNLQGSFASNVRALYSVTWTTPGFYKGLSLSTVNLLGGSAEAPKTWEATADKDTTTFTGPMGSIGTMNIGKVDDEAYIQLADANVNDTNPASLTKVDEWAVDGEVLLATTLNIVNGKLNLGGKGVILSNSATSLTIAAAGQLDLAAGVDQTAGTPYAKFFAYGDQTGTWINFKARVVDTSTVANQALTFDPVYDAIANKTYWQPVGTATGDVSASSGVAVNPGTLPVGYNATLVITVVDTGGFAITGLTNADFVISGVSVIGTVTETVPNVSGIYTATLSHNMAEVATISVTVSGTALTTQPTVDFDFDPAADFVNYLWLGVNSASATAITQTNTGDGNLWRNVTANTTGQVPLANARARFYNNDEFPAYRDELFILPGSALSPGAMEVGFMTKVPLYILKDMMMINLFNNWDASEGTAGTEYCRIGSPGSGGWLRLAAASAASVTGTLTIKSDQDTVGTTTADLTGMTLAQMAAEINLYTATTGVSAYVATDLYIQRDTIGAGRYVELATSGVFPSIRYAGQTRGNGWDAANVTITLTGANNPLSFGQSTGTWFSIRMYAGSKIVLNNSAIAFSDLYQGLWSGIRTGRSGMGGSGGSLEFTAVEGSVTLPDPGIRPDGVIGMGVHQLKVRSDQTWSNPTGLGVIRETLANGVSMVQSIDGPALNNLDEVPFYVNLAASSLVWSINAGEYQGFKTTGDTASAGTTNVMQLTGDVAFMGYAVTSGSAFGPVLAAVDPDYNSLVLSSTQRQAFVLDLNEFDLAVAHGLRLYATASGTYARETTNSRYIDASASTLTIGGDLVLNSGTNNAGYSEWTVGPDGQWGVALVDDDGNTIIDDLPEMGWPSSDDVQVLFEHSQMGITGDAATVINLQGSFATNLRSMSAAYNGLTLSTVNLLGGEVADLAETWEVTGDPLTANFAAGFGSIGTMNIGGAGDEASIMLVNDSLNDNDPANLAKAKDGEILLVGTLNIVNGKLDCNGLGVLVGSATLSISAEGTLDLHTGTVLSEGMVYGGFAGVGNQAAAWNAFKTRVVDSTPGNDALTFEAVYVAGDNLTYWKVPGGAPSELAITASADFSWVYQNTATTTIDRHKSVLTVNITDGSAPSETYAITIQENHESVTNFQITQPVSIVPGTPQTVNALGGRRDLSLAGNYTLNVTVTGTPGGQTATADVPLTLRLLADIDGDGSVTASDKLEMNKSLNGLATLPGIGLRELDLTGDGATVNAEDKLVINQVLNGLIVP